MKKNIIRIIILFITIIILTILYFNSNFFIRNQQWKYNEGSHIGDFVELNNQTLRYRTIYKGNAAIAKVVFCFGKTLVIKDVKSGEKGYYSNKSLVKR